MSKFSERKIQRVIDSFMDLNPTEFIEVQKRMQTYKPEERNESCGFLNLPAEIRNIIYQYVAEDAHAAVAVPEKTRFIEYAQKDVTLALDLRDGDGNKVQPGLLGTCRDISKESHGVFYSPEHIKAWLWELDSGEEIVKHPALLDAIVNNKHSIWTVEVDQTLDEVRGNVPQIPELGVLAKGFREVTSSSGSSSYRMLSVLMFPPWHCQYNHSGTSRPTSTCLDMATSRQVPSKADRCALCIISMGLPRSASQARHYSL